MGVTNGSQDRMSAVMTAAGRRPRVFEPPRGEDGRIRVSATYGQRTFGLARLREKLPSKTFAKLTACIDRGESLDASIAGAVAHAAKEWAIENGATHFCHWFQPLTGLTAEKHDAFLKIEEGRPVEGFDGSQLIQSEPDASSFPSGGMRSTFEARGYTAWDPSSPMFLRVSSGGSTLCIPSAYMSYYGNTLDEKTGLLRSLEALNQAVTSLLGTVGYGPVVRVTATLGSEQEYFLVDRALVALRPDLLVAGRTVLGAASTKGQELEDHYFGSISPRVLSFMSEFEHELYLLGVPVKTRHNEVAPGQFETAPIFEEANVAADHNQLTMEVIRQVARRHEFDVFFHEKPFAGINGSGKHLNWAVAAKKPDGSWENLFEPGETPEANLNFLLLTGCVLRAVHRHAGVLRASISGAGNDHRLGANEAPPAIISMFLGSALTEIFDALAEGVETEGGDDTDALSLGVAGLPHIRRDTTDRNRTSPFAFTGNKWEFRACGSSMAISFPVSVLNAAFAEAVGEVDQALQVRIAGGQSAADAVSAVLAELAAETRAIRFEGDNYSEEWVEEAESRGLPNLRKTPEALAWMAQPARHEFLVETGVFSADEVQARVHVRTERYLKDLDIEYLTLIRLLDTSVIPAGAGYLGELARSVVATKQAGLEAPHAGRAGEVAGLLGELGTARDRLVALKKDIDGAAAGDGSDDGARAARYAAELTRSMEDCRGVADRLEELCGERWWTLPRYMEMLFIR